MNKYYGEQKIYHRVKKSGEAWSFGITEGDIENFLQQWGLDLIEYMDSTKLEKKYFQDKKNKIIGKVNETHCIVYAKIIA